VPRENQERFVSKGMRTGSPPDAFSKGEYPLLLNVRGNTTTELETRAGHSLKFATAASQVKNIGSYTQGTTPRYLAAVGTSVYLDTGAVVDTGYGSIIPSMLPFRPNASPQPWMYVADKTQYRKLSSPSATNVVTAQNVGIAEPQQPPGLVLFESPSQSVYALDAPGHWTNNGACGSVSAGMRSTDTIQGIFRDPLSIASEGTGTVTLQVTPGIIYQRDELLDWTDSVSGLVVDSRLNDVFSALPAGIAISGIYYFSGTTGKCIVIPNLLASGEPSIFADAVMANLRRGALVKIGTEVCYVLDVETSPFGSVSFTTTTTGTHTTSETLAGVPGIQVFRGALVDALTVSQAIASYQWQFHANSGIGSVQENLINGLFLGNNGAPFQSDDYLCFGIYMPNPENLVEMKIVLNVTAGSVNYQADTYFYAVRPSDIQAGLQNTLTQLGVAQLFTQRQLIEEESQVGGAASSTQAVPGADQWSQIAIPLRELIRTGSDESRSLMNLLGIQFLFNCTGSGTDVAISSILTHGQRQVDVGKVGQPILYRVRGRSSVTGAKSNPSPPTRFGWSPRRQGNLVFMPTVPDSQMDLWDVFRIGGTLDTYRLAGTISTSDPYFYDDYGDTTIAQSEVLEFDNLQPWPTLDLPLSVASATVNGYILTFSLASGDPHLLTIPRYLPGNLVRVNQTVYTLFNRPTVVGTAVTMQVIENAGTGTGALFIYEPLMANQPLPFLWGPDEYGVVFGVGDSNRPGNVYFAKNFNPDSAPDKRNLELSPPSEPLTGGALHAGESLCCSLDHWWALRPAFSGPSAYTQRLLTVEEGAVSHFAIWSDGREVYFVGRSGVQTVSGKKLTTRENIESLFVQEGSAGEAWSYLGYTLYPPDYKQASKFRLSGGNGFLYFDYPNTHEGTSHLVCDLIHNAWYVDTFAMSNVTMHYAVPQQDTSANTFILAGDWGGNVLLETPFTKDNGSAIACVVATREICPGEWLWSWFENPGIDILPTYATALLVQGVSLATLIGSATTFQGAVRVTQGIVDLGGGLPLKSLGLVFTWSQTYTAPEVLPVKLYGMEWVAVPYPSPILSQRTKGSSFGVRGFQHVYLGQLAFIPVAVPIVLTVTPDQGAAFTITIPAQPIVPYPVKFAFKFPPNKFKMASYDLAASTQFYLWPEDCEIWMKQWGSDGEYQVLRPFGGESGAVA
jgi:hypothetical protein